MHGMCVCDDFNLVGVPSLSCKWSGILQNEGRVQTQNADRHARAQERYKYLMKNHDAGEGDSSAESTEQVTDTQLS